MIMLSTLQIASPTAPERSHARLTLAAMAAALALQAGPANALSFEVTGTQTVATNYGTINDDMMLTGCGTLVWTGSINPLRGTTVDCGILSIGNGGTSGSIDGNIYVSDGTLIFNRSNPLTYAGVISGFAPLVKQGIGMLTLTGNHTYSGGTRIDAGLLMVGNGGTSGSISGDVVNNGTLAFNRSDLQSFAGNISGSGGLLKQAGATLTLTGTNTYSGGTTISGGMLTVGNGGTAGSIVGNVVNNGILSFNRSDAQVFAGRITGNGALLKQAGNTLTLTGTNTYSGGTEILGGTLTVGNGFTAGSISGNVYNEGILAFNRRDAQTFSGDISGSGKLMKLSFNSLKLTGTNTYSGGTTIFGGALEIGNGGTSGSIIGNVNNLGTLAFNRSDAQTFAGDISGSGGLLKLAGNILTLTGTNTYSGGTTILGGDLQIGNGGTSGSISGNVNNHGTLTFNRSDAQSFAGDISGTGGLLKRGGDTLTLTGTNTYSGGTTIFGGALQIGNGGTAGSITGNVVNNGALVFYRGDPQVFAGAISGSGILVQLGRNTLTLTGTNTYSGLTMIAGGVLQIGNGGTAGSIAGNVENYGTLVFNRSDSFTFTGNVFGNGSLIKKGAGSLTITGDHSYGTNLVTGIPGGINIEEGTLILGDRYNFNVAQSVNINNNATLKFQTASYQQITANISGRGSLVKEGQGFTFLDGQNNSTGDILINEGTLLVRANPTLAMLGGNVINNARLVIYTDRNVTYAGNLQGRGAIEFHQPTGGAAPIVTLLGENSSTGSYILSAVSLNVGNGGTRGTISGNVVSVAENVALTFNRSDATQYGGNLSGQLRLVKAGAGTLTFSGVNTSSGDTVVSAGELKVDGEIRNGVVEVERDAVVSGSGRLSTLHLNGTVAPGHDVGRLAATQASFAAGSRYAWDIKDAAGLAGIDYDTLHLDGNLILDTVANGSVITIQIRSLGADGSSGLAANFDARKNSRFALVSGLGIIGFDASRFAIDTTDFYNDLQGGTWSVYATGGDLFLDFTTAVPEASSWQLFLAGLTVAYFAAGRRRKHGKGLWQ